MAISYTRLRWPVRYTQEWGFEGHSKASEASTAHKKDSTMEFFKQTRHGPTLDSKAHKANFLEGNKDLSNGISLYKQPWMLRSLMFQLE